MSRRKKPARLYLRKARGGRAATWTILSGSREISTGCAEHELERAQAKLAEFFASQYRPPTGISGAADLYVSEIMIPYVREHAPTSPSAKWIIDMATDISRFWANKRLSQVTKVTCQEYVAWRTAQRLTTTSKRTVSKATARHELSVLRAAIRYFRAEHASLMNVPVVTLPDRPEPRQGYSLDRDQLAKRLRAAWRRPETRHIARLILIGIYSGSRLNTMLQLRWLTSTHSSWIDLDREDPIIHRRGTAEEDTKKRRPPCLVHRRLLPHLRRWKARDLAAGVSHVIFYDGHYNGQPIKDPYHAWESVRIAAGATTVDRPHVLRHSCVTLFVKAKLSLPEIASFTGMTTAVLERYYLHGSLEDQANIAATAPKIAPRNGTKRAGSK